MNFLAHMETMLTFYEEKMEGANKVHSLSLPLWGARRDAVKELIEMWRFMEKHEVING